MRLKCYPKLLLHYALPLLQNNPELKWLCCCGISSCCKKKDVPAVAVCTLAKAMKTWAAGHWARGFMSPSKFLRPQIMLQMVGQKVHTRGN